MPGFISAEPKKSTSNCQAKRRDKEMYKNKGDKKGAGKLTFVYQKEKACLYFLKIKTTSSHKVIF